MKRSRIVETKYKGYVIKPAVTGFKVFRKGYYIEQYSTLQIARNRIDKVVEKLVKSGGETKNKEAPESDQLLLF